MEVDMNVKEAHRHTHSLSNTSKMPGKSYGIQAKFCGIGAKLAKVEGTVCSSCYGMNGFYHMPSTIKAEDIRMDLMLNDPLWEDGMVVKIERLKEPWFRWFDNGDLQSIYNLERIVRVCERTPRINHWLPTKEYGIVNEWLDNGGLVPTNLAIRPSGYKMNGTPPVFKGKFIKMAELPTSTATRLDEDGEPINPSGSVCPAHWQDGQCRDCRKCWNKEVQNVTYIDQLQKV